MEAERARLETDVPGLIAEAIRAKEAERVKLSMRASGKLWTHSISSRIITGICKPARGRSSAACPISALSYRKKI